jgi:hypothetical protein
MMSDDKPAFTVILKPDPIHPQIPPTRLDKLGELRLFVEAMGALLVLLSICCLAAAQLRLAFEGVSIKRAPQPTPETIRSGAFRRRPFYL